MQLLSTIFKAENIGISFNLIIESFQEITELFWKYKSFTLLSSLFWEENLFTYLEHFYPTFFNFVKKDKIRRIVL